MEFKFETVPLSQSQSDIRAIGEMEMKKKKEKKITFILAIVFECVVPRVCVSTTNSFEYRERIWRRCSLSPLSSVRSLPRHYQLPIK